LGPYAPRQLPWPAVKDLLFVALIGLFFALTWLYVRAVERS
jgi:hypothetical protein